MSCPRCNTQSATVKTIIRGGQLVECCENCMNFHVKPNELAAQHRRSSQQKEYRRDITQPFESGYVKARGIEAAREKGWTDEQIRKHS